MFKFSFNNTQTIYTALPFVRLKDFVVSVVDRIRCVESNGYRGKHATSTLYNEFGITIWTNSSLRTANRKIPGDSVFNSYLEHAEREDIAEYVHSHLDLLMFTISIDIKTDRSFENPIRGRFMNTQALQRLLQAYLPRHTTEELPATNTFEAYWAEYDGQGFYEGKFLEILEDCMNHSESRFINNGKIRIPSRYFREPI